MRKQTRTGRAGARPARESALRALTAAGAWGLLSARMDVPSRVPPPLPLGRPSRAKQRAEPNGVRLVGRDELEVAPDVRRSPSFQHGPQPATQPPPHRPPGRAES